MGVVYSGAELLQGSIPGPDDHLKAAHAVLSEVSALDETQLTVVHGSVPDGRFNVRSDLDVLVTYKADTPATEPSVVRAVNNRLDRISADTHVKIEANIWPSDEGAAARRERMYDLLFSRHLAKSIVNPDWAIGEPEETIQEIAEASYEDGILRAVILNYTTYKHAGFAKAPSVYSESDRVLAAFQRALELPKSLDRKVGQFLGTDIRSANALSDLGMHDDTVEAMETLRRLDHAYTDALVPFQTKADLPTAEEVADYSGWLADSYASAIDNGLIAASGFSHFASDC